MNQQEINDKLLLLHGRDVISSQPHWRLIWTPDVMTKRECEWNDFTPAGLFIGKRRGIKEVPKYWWIPPCFMLEKLYLIDNPELSNKVQQELHDEVKASHTYEGIFPFLGRHNELLPLSWKVIEKCIYYWGKADSQAAARREEIKAVQKAKDYEDEVNRNRHILHADDPKEQPTFKSSVYVNESESGVK